MVGVLNLLALVWVIYDVLSYQKKMPDVEKLIWVIVAIFLGLIGAVLYFLLVKSKGKYEGKREDFT
jgi:cytochrome bd-type quinol oxidase subunit 2